ncbi:MAG: Tm-1-like ATP-binding domain-containing protein, partial [Pseudomonadota bacterium]
MKAIHIAGTCDTKGEEIAYLRDLIVAAGQPAVIVDLGTRAPTIRPDIQAADVAACHPLGTAISATDRGAAVSAMGTAFAAWCRASADRISGIIAVGGGGGTSIACAGMRELPYGAPKLMISTLASGDTAAYVGTSDIIMVPSVTDIAGLYLAPPDNAIVLCVDEKSQIQALDRTAPMLPMQPMQPGLS